MVTNWLNKMGSDVGVTLPDDGKMRKGKCAAPRSGLPERERDGEDTPGRIGTEEPDSPAMSLGDPPRDRQTESRPSAVAVGPSAGGMDIFV
jgi:hypothetical protein